MMKHTFALLSAMALVVVGCESTGNKDMGMFETEDAPSPVRVAVNRQAALGAKSDGMIHPVHFTGAKLNDLGKAKLAAILSVLEADESATLYLNVTDDTLAARKASLEQAIADMGASKELITIETGINPASFARSDTSLKAYKSEAGGESGDAAATDVSSMLQMTGGQ